ncbi:MAG: hypothetical protein LPK19_10505 [Hymenobacteraceae bacterium]|nr:hypothetical protein [Hymenobacteraceae bacterium]MDX5396662.1 hypothetical protein [Hymenobacteraceae bacterium]MDX5512725.1 hypothetical protein [Hymenobacteraceae bacterium]
MNFEAQSTLKTAISITETEQVQKRPLFTPLSIAGLVCMVVSLIVFLLPEFGIAPSSNDPFTGVFMVNYFIAGGYLLTLLLVGAFNRKKSERRVETFLLFLVLALISCFSLNKEIPIFQNSAVWLQVYLCIISASFIAFYFREALPKYLLHLVLLVMGSASVGMLYFSL